MNSPTSAASRAVGMLGERWPYVLGTGNHRGPTMTRRKDGPSPIGFDCWGFISYCYQMPRTVLGFNKGPWATVSDAVNCDSSIEEAEHIGKTYQVVPIAHIGDLLVMPSIRDAQGKRIRIGHVWIVVGVPAEAPPAGRFDAYDTVQCQASTRPAIKRGPGPKSDARTYKGLTDEAWRIRVLRVVQRVP